MKNLFLVFCLAVFFACTDDGPYCGVEDPEEDLPWLNEMIENYEKYGSKEDIEIYKNTYGSTEGFYITYSCDNCVDLMNIYYNCDGENVCMFYGSDGENSCPDFKDSTTYKELLWHN